MCYSLILVDPFPMIMDVTPHQTSTMTRSGVSSLCLSALSISSPGEPFNCKTLQTSSQLGSMPSLACSEDDDSMRTANPNSSTESLGRGLVRGWGSVESRRGYVDLSALTSTNRNRACTPLRRLPQPDAVSTLTTHDCGQLQGPAWGYFVDTPMEDQEEEAMTW